jgi:hypothetical protein
MSLEQLFKRYGQAANLEAAGEAIEQAEAFIT